MSNYFGKMNKSQLAEYARPLGISTTLKKQDLVEQIEAAVARDRSALEKDTLFQDYFETLTDSPKSLVRAITPRSTTRRRSRYSKAPEDEEDTREHSSEPPSDLVTPAKKPTKVGVRSTRKATSLRSDTTVVVSPPVVPPVVHEAPDIIPEPNHPLSPSQVAQSVAVESFTVDKISEGIASWFANAAETTGFWEHVDYTRETLSDPRAIHFLIATYELAWLCHDLTPWSIVTVPVPAARVPYMDYNTGPTTVKVPDLFILLSWNAFWSPIVYWFTLGISFPLLSSYFVNVRKRSTYDPLTFSISKALIAYLVYTKQILKPELPRLFGSDTPALINEIIGDETPLIGAAIGGLLTLWEAILSRR
ncbi:hypothetical protein TWF970_003482 [Orbilia oligospora]|uniref:SAP domain-containing protein n=1 Tax=Orbilia oligospora TaxID=2813651 RepID=A0A7C8VF96_ORBOL|nr:hypothetical protein TWF970_003482 [Orbilia oligospora]